MQPDNAAFQMFNASVEMIDPGASGVITVDRSPCVVNLQSLAAETRTLDRATRAGAIVSLHMQIDTGDITVTVTGGYDEIGTTTIVFSEVGQYAVFQSYMTSAGVFFWRLLSTHAFGNLAGLTATAAEINAAADISANVEVLAATRVLTAADNGKTLFLSHATEFDTKLPAPALGLRFLFIVGLAPAGANYTITTDGTTQNVIHGLTSSGEDAAGAGAGTNGTPVDVITFVASKAMIGDWVELICDGTLWYARGQCYQQDAITLA